jgi:lactate dehydrogenase-like 2-hydroxyacid dehydrogenase
LPDLYKCHAAEEFIGWGQVRLGPIQWTTGPLPDNPDDINGLIATPNLPVSKELLVCMPQLMVISAYGVGYDYIDIEAASELGILVTHTPGAVVQATAELGLGLILASIRHIVKQDRAIRHTALQPGSAEFPPPVLSHDASSRIIGLIGYGRIGRRLGSLLHALNIPFVYHRRSGPLDNHRGYRSLPSLLNEADIVVLVTPLTAETYHLIDAEALTQMKATAVLINIGRGACVDEKALIQALMSKQIGGAALDVYENEPQIPPELIGMDNVILSPHAGTQTWETRLSMTEDAVGNVVAALEGHPRNTINSQSWGRRPG